MRTEDKLQWRIDLNIQTDLCFYEYGTCTLGIILHFILGTSDEMYLEIYVRSNLGYLIGVHNIPVIWFEMFLDNNNRVGKGARYV